MESVVCSPQCGSCGMNINTISATFSHLNAKLCYCSKAATLPAVFSVNRLVSEMSPVKPHNVKVELRSCLLGIYADCLFISLLAN